MSWLRGGAQEWNNQFRDTLNRAANSVQRFAEQAELQQLGEQFLAQAQTLAEQGEAALSNVADKVTGGVSSLGLSSSEGLQESREDLVHRFVREAKHLEPPGGSRLLVADVAQVLRAWKAAQCSSSSSCGHVFFSCSHLA
ncbi:Slc8a3 [Symbiodinium natans]|uniref:Slc8a3 protein n=1 Tax=Symbiodinium natans TaxID=878477 RepID=A0A812TR23_9DINO|nr:Slc8a3 [Symbiodinium natans]